MAKFKYGGEDERVLPTLGVVVNKGDVIEAPDDFSAFGFSPVDPKSTKDQNKDSEVKE